MLAGGVFDALVCECAYCTFPDKATAAREIARVLWPGACFGLGDVTRTGSLPHELDTLLSWLACIGDALPVEGYVRRCEMAGLRIERIEPHDEALAEQVQMIRGRLVSAEVLLKLRQIDLSGVDLRSAKALATCAADAIRAGSLGYCLIVATKPRSD
jgi:hypothetical protein